MANTVNDLRAIRSYWSSPTGMAKAQEAAPGLVEYAQRTITDLVEEVSRLRLKVAEQDETPMRLRYIVEAQNAGLRQALERLVRETWAEFGTDLTDNENTKFDRAYIAACGALGLDPDGTTWDETTDPIGSSEDPPNVGDQGQVPS